MSSIKLIGETSGEVILKAPAVAGSSEVTLPTGTVDLANYVTASSTSTFTNKSGNISQWTNDSNYAAENGAATFTTLNATTVDLGNWTITESGGVLYFATGGTNKMKLDASGNLTCVGDVTAFGTV
tara:strand:- start:5651 stop:6028 length:378 start_codon:yes stop_codon:yes gene_type:complete